MAVGVYLSSLLLRLALFPEVRPLRVHLELRLRLPRLYRTMRTRRQLLRVQVLCPSLCPVER
jgi:hypothetical protein